MLHTRIMIITNLWLLIIFSRFCPIKHNLSNLINRHTAEDGILLHKSAPTSKQRFRPTNMTRHKQITKSAYRKHKNQPNFFHMQHTIERQHRHLAQKKRTSNNERYFRNSKQRQISAGWFTLRGERKKHFLCVRFFCNISFLAGRSRGGSAPKVKCYRLTGQWCNGAVRVPFSFCDPIWPIALLICVILCRLFFSLLLLLLVMRACEKSSVSRGFRLTFE